MIHATGSPASWASSTSSIDVVSVAEALVKIGGNDGKAIVQRAAKDPMTQPDVARALGALAPG